MARHIYDKAITALSRRDAERLVGSIRGGVLIT